MTTALLRTLCPGRWPAAIVLLSLAVLLVACGGRVSRVRPDGGQGGGPGSGQAGSASELTPQVLVVRLEGVLGTPEIARCHRALREAEARGIGRVLFWLRDAGAFGEDADDLHSLFDHVQSTSVATVALVQGRVTQGAAYLALLTDKSYCTPNAQWGEITKPDAELTELLAADPDAAQSRRLAAVREALTTRMARKKQPLSPDQQKLAFAMVDPRVQIVQATVREGGIERSRVLDSNELAGQKGSGAVVLAETLLPRPLVLSAQEAEDLGLSGGTVQGIEPLATDVLLVAMDAVGELDSNWAEHMVGWLEWMQPFLLVLGFLLILFEVKTPGVGLPGVLGTAFLGLAMFYSYLVGLAEITEILVFFLGLLALAVEIFVLPGTVVFGAIGFLCLVLSLVLSHQSFFLPSNAVEEDILLANLINLTLLFALVLGLGAMFWRILPRLPLFNRVMLAAPGQDLRGARVAPGAAAGGAAAGGAAGGSSLGIDTRGLTALVGRTGTAATVLRPSGTMEIEGERIDVVTEGEFLTAGSELRVLYVHGNRVVVAAAAGKGETGSGATTDPQSGSVGIVLLLGMLGLGLLVAEVFFVSFGVIAVLAGLALVSAVFVAFQESTSFGITVLVAEAIAAPVVVMVALRLLPHTSLGKSLILAGPQTQGHGGAADPGLADLLHKTGTALSALRPAGLARIEGRRVDVVTRGEMIDADTPIRVLDVTGNRVVVGRNS